MLMKKRLLYLLALPVVMLLLASCHCEEDDFIDRPDPKSLIIKGVAKTPDGQPIPNIELKCERVAFSLQIDSFFRIIFMKKKNYFHERKYLFT